MSEPNLGKPVIERDPAFLARIRALPCVVCGAPAPSTVSHIKTRGSGGGDQWFNCTPKCIKCHIAWESSSAFEFCQKHPKFAAYLGSLGWYFDGFRLKHPELMKGPVFMRRRELNERG